MIAIIGADGSMGQRYQAILRHLRVDYRCFDVEHSMDDIKAACEDARGIIIATPTYTHITFLREILPLRKMVLCEKPVSYEIEALREFTSWCSGNGYSFTVMMQYGELVSYRSVGDSFYDYFRHGPDGLIWDCFQVIVLANGTIRLAEQSPFWDCCINGTRMLLSDMDGAYVRFVHKWLSGSIHHSPSMILNWHEKVDCFAKEFYGRED